MGRDHPSGSLGGSRRWEGAGGGGVATPGEKNSVSNFITRSFVFVLRIYYE